MESNFTKKCAMIKYFRIILLSKWRKAIQAIAICPHIMHSYKCFESSLFQQKNVHFCDLWLHIIPILIYDPTIAAGLIY